MAELEIVCLANSRKHGGRCVAGWRTDGGGFVRLVSPLPDGTLSPFDLRLCEGDEPRMFDLIRVGVAARRPAPHQPENWVIDESPWKLLRRPAPRRTLEGLLPLIERGPAILGTTGVAIAWTEYLTKPAAASLAIVRPQNPSLFVADRLGRRRLRLGFALRGARYELTVTDPAWEAAVALWEEGEYRWWQLFKHPRPPVITVSLTAPFGDPPECFKVAAMVWPGPEARTAPRAKPSVVPTRRRTRRATARSSSTASEFSPPAVSSAPTRQATAQFPLAGRRAAP